VRRYSEEIRGTGSVRSLRKAQLKAAIERLLISGCSEDECLARIHRGEHDDAAPRLGPAVVQGLVP
jgi:hypothetical protein